MNIKAEKFHRRMLLPSDRRQRIMNRHDRMLAQRIGEPYEPDFEGFDRWRRLQNEIAERDCKRRD